MEPVALSHTQPFPPNAMTLPDLLDMARKANPKLIEHVWCSPYPNGSQYSVNFRLAHLFRELGIPQISGEFDIDSKRNEDGCVEYSAQSTIIHEHSKLTDLTVTVSSAGSLISVYVKTHVDESIPGFVITAAKRILRLAMRETAEYMSGVLGTSRKTI
jgi:hypothetical protein